jgi:hypothetical protein
MEDNILREYPKLKNVPLYEDRYNKEDFERYKDIKNSIENYEKWKIGINYKTGKKIKIGGKKHIQVGYENFYIEHKIGGKNHKGKKHKTLLDNYSYILFTELDDINIELYIQETETLEEIKNEVLSHNVRVKDIICKINELKWVDFVEFEGMKYGIPKIYHNILSFHRENDCNGIMNIHKNKVGPECRRCNGNSSFNERCSCKYEKYMECRKCGYKEPS